MGWLGEGKEPAADMIAGGTGFIFSSLFFSDFLWQVLEDTENTTKARRLTNTRHRRIQFLRRQNNTELSIPTQYQQKPAKTFGAVGVSERDGNSKRASEGGERSRYSPSDSGHSQADSRHPPSFRRHSPMFEKG